jgi:hypothetical protein
MTNILIKMIPEKGKPVLWEELSWNDIESLTKTMKMVIMPIGACEQHGPHLPLAVDTIDLLRGSKKSFCQDRSSSYSTFDVRLFTKSWQISRNTVYQTRIYDKDDM